MTKFRSCKAGDWTQTPSKASTHRLGWPNATRRGRADQRPAELASSPRVRPTPASAEFIARGRKCGLLLSAACSLLVCGSCVPAAGQSQVAGSPSAVAATELFGISATGSRLVYVFDVSASTSGAPLRVAKQELWSSIARLQRTHQIQIVFYNQTVRFLSIRGEAPRLYWADDETKRSARRFIQGAKANGGTNHVDALKIALDMQPDVIFLYTDAEDPQLSDGELARIRALNGSAVIHAIQFGHGQQANEVGREETGDPANNFLVRLANQNGGEYRYVDVTRWGPRR